LDNSGLKINGGDYYYCQLIHDTAVFFLARGLRHVFVNGMIDEIAVESKWRMWLRIYENRWEAQATRSRIEASSDRDRFRR
jgi:hypothetical protein